MSIDLKLDSNHDLALSAGNDSMLVDGLDRIRQQITVTLLTFMGEWFLDTTFGVPYFERIMIKSPNRAEVENIIRSKVRDVPGVEAVPSVEIQIDARLRQGRITLPDIQTNEGPISVSVMR